MSLRRAFMLISALPAAAGLGSGVALISITTVLHELGNDIGTSVESIRVAEELEIELLTHRAAAGSSQRLPSEERLRDLLGEAAASAGSAGAEALVARLAAQIAGYIEATREAVPGALEAQQQAQAGFEAAFSSVRNLVRTNVEQSRMLRRSAARWDRFANLAGTVVAVAFIAGLGALAFWLRSAAFQPALALADAIERYSTGERAVRAPEAGAQEFRSIARRFNEMASAIEQQRQVQLTFLAGVAHDLRNPLAALGLASAVIAPDRPLPSEERIRQSFERVQRQVDRLGRMVNDLLDTARMEAGDLGLVTEECDAREIVRATAALFQPTAPDHHLAVTVPDEPVRLACDPARIEQALNNLVSNAIKYSPEGGAVRIGVESRDGAVLISVGDDGIGMSPDDAEYLFEPFRRTAASRATIPGVGLGLFVTKRIIEAHGGHITVQSAPGKGTTFTMRFPARYR